MIEQKNGYPFYDREMSWLSFNGRVLQEADNPQNPLIERLGFLAIFSSNLDEFYRVRVASLRSLIRLKKKAREDIDLRPKKLLKQINKKVDDQQKQFGSILREKIIPGLAEKGIYFHYEHDLNALQQQDLANYCQQHLINKLSYFYVDADHPAPFLENQQLYFYLRLKNRGKYADVILKIPSDEVGRFIVLEEQRNGFHIITLDDAIRINLHQLFPDHEVVYCHAIKLTRDAELYLEDEFAEQVVDKIRQSLQKRDRGMPSRFLYDSSMPEQALDRLKEWYNLRKEDLIPGGKYHNLNDLWDFPYPDDPSLVFSPQPALHYSPFENCSSIAAQVAGKDHCLFFPYQDYKYVLAFLQEASEDPEVTSIKMTIYRVASRSAVCQALVKAAQNGKEIIVFDEVQARFDEASNIYWGEQLQKAGAKVLYSHEGLKVHGKLGLVTRKKNGSTDKQALLSTGNFNEKTANVYCDLALFTSDPTITEEVDKIFDWLPDPKQPIAFDRLLVAPHELRTKVYELIDREINHALQGNEAKIFAKMNSLQDKRMVQKLYEANRAGVKIKLLVRGICSLVPGVKGISDNIEIRSIVGRYLEHARVYVFHNNGSEETYCASADWMTRNLNRRVEVGFPIDDQEVYRNIRKMMDLQWADNVNARIIDKEQTNPYYNQGQEKIDSQKGFYHDLQRYQSSAAEAVQAGDKSE